MLNDLLTTGAFAFGLVFARMGSTVMLLPGFAESYVSPRIRLMFALALSLVVTPVVSIHLPPMPPSMVGAAVLVGGEVIIGVFMGGLVRMLPASSSVFRPVCPTRRSLILPMRSRVP